MSEPAATKPELGECPLTASHTRRPCDSGGSCWCVEHPEEVASINAHPDVIEARTAESCPVCRKNPVTTEIEGRVLVCAECANDPKIREHARTDWR